MLRVGRVTRLNRFAIRHPFLASLLMFVMLVVWLSVVSKLSLLLAVAVGGTAALINAGLWIPRVGPLWKYASRVVEAHDSKSSPTN